jgi:hypothetical protein
MKSLISVILFITALGETCHAQDMIIISRIAFDSVECKIISADKHTVFYSTPDSKQILKIPQDSIARISFGESTDRIFMPLVEIDTIVCKIHKINSEDVEYYTEKNRKIQTLPKSVILVCFLQQTCTSDEETVYLKKFLQFHNQLKRINGNKIIKQNNISFNVSKIEINDDFIFFNAEVTDARTYIMRKQVSGIVFSDYIIRSLKGIDCNYLLTRKGNLNKSLSISIDSSMLSLEVSMNDNIFNTETPINEICAIFFGPSEINFADKPHVRYRADEHEVKNDKIDKKDKKEKDAKLEFTISGCWAHQFRPALQDLPAELSNYEKKLRSGNGFNGALNIYTGSHSSVGFNYQFLNLNNAIYNLTIPDIESLSNKINMNFYGLNYQYSSTATKKGFINFAVAPGIITYSSDSTINRMSYEYTGKSFGLKLISRYGLMVNSSVGFCFDISLFLGSIKKYKYEGATYSFGNPKNLSRIELGLGMKFQSR